MSLLGIDVGTTASKAAAFDEQGRLLASASREYPLQTTPPDHLELDADQVWAAVSDCIRQVTSRVGDDPVEALAVSSQGEAVTPLGRDGRALALSPVTFDSRGVGQVQRLEESIGRAELMRITGQPPHPMHAIAKLMWWQDHVPDLVQRTWKFLCYGDLIGFRLGADPAIDHSMAARTMAFDIRTRGWSAPILAAAGIDEAKLATSVAAGTPVGRVDSAVATSLGFRGRPLIVVGGHDQPCGALGAGVTASGEALLAIGTTICLAPVFPAPRHELLERGYPCYPHVVPDHFITLAGNFTGGSLLRWYRDTFGSAERQDAVTSNRDVYDLLVEQAGIDPSPLLVLPHFAGSGAPHNDPTSKGAMLGLSFATDRGQIIRSCLESVLFEMAHNRECLAETGVLIDAVVASGGGARSDRWLQIAADILAVPVRRAPQVEAACWGAAWLAGIGAGRLRPANGSLVGEWDQSRAVDFTPDPARTEYYQERLAVYRAVYTALQPINRAL